MHSGYGFAIGNVAAFDMDDPTAVVSPGGVGFDINCGVVSYLSYPSKFDMSVIILALFLFYLPVTAAPQDQSHGGRCGARAREASTGAVSHYSHIFNRLTFFVLFLSLRIFYSLSPCLITSPSVSALKVLFPPRLLTWTRLLSSV